MNLFEELENILDQDLIEKLSSVLPNDKPEAIALAVKAVEHTLVAGLIRRSGSEMSSGMLLNQLRDNNPKVNFIKNFKTEYTDKEYIDKCTVEGSKIISQIFPAYKSPLLSLISGFAGTSKSGSVLVSSVVGLILTDILSTKAIINKYDKTALINFLREHHEVLFERMPEGLNEKMIPALGLQELTNAKSFQIKKLEAQKNSMQGESDDSTVPEEAEAEEGGTFLNKKVLVALLGLVLLGGGGYFAWINQDQLKGVFSSKAEEPDPELAFADSLNNIKADTLKVDTLVVQKADSLQASKISDFVALKSYMSNASEAQGKTFDFSTIQYIDDTFELTEGSLTVIDSVATLMKTYGRMQIKITAYSESGNTQLNNKRAFAVKKQLLKNGIEGIKIDAASGGKGENFPEIKVVTK